MSTTYRQIRAELASINLKGKSDNQKGNHEILVNWTKPFDNDAIVSPQSLRKIRKRIDNIKKNIVKMSEITKSKIQALSDSINTTLCNLYSRWQDEKEYEDWNDYIAHMKKIFEAMIVSNTMTNAVYYSCGKRPFGLTFDFEGFRVKLYANSTHCGWKSEQL